MNKINTQTAIIVAGIIIAIAIIIVGGDFKTNSPKGTDQTKEIALAPITKDDHILGSRDAEITIVEYSDTECPFCKRFHITLGRIIDEYKDDGSVAWVYRHFPLDSIHPKARTEALATECAGELGGNDGFWRYIDRLFEITPSNNGLDLSLLPEIAEDVGINKDSFNECLSSKKYEDHIQDDLQSGIDAGVRGTPGSFLVLKNGDVITLPGGAQPYEVVKNFIEEQLK